jgi:predicted flavoprotein YhiN
LKNLKLPKSVLSIIKASIATREEYLDDKTVANRVKNFPLIINGFRPIDEVISTVGGIDMHEINENFQVKKYPSVYCIGEMLDWDAPTGGYLIQGAVSSGCQAAESIINLDRSAED